MIGITAEDFISEQSPLFEEQYTGRMEVYGEDIYFNDYKKKGIPTDAIYIIKDGKKQIVKPEYNQFFIIRSETNEKKTLLGRYDGQNIVALKYLKIEPFGVQPRNVGQRLLQEALLEDAQTAPLVIVKGTAGTAKTFYSLAVGLDRIMETTDHPYRKILIT